MAPLFVSCRTIGYEPVTGGTVMNTVTIEEAQARLTEIIDKLAAGEEVLITRNEQPVARLVGQVQSARKPRQPGTCRGMLIIVSDDDEHLKDFANYMS
jgi:prevent-host-death family protein